MIGVATHGHFDHVGGLHEFEDRRVHADDADMTRAPYPMRLLQGPDVDRRPVRVGAGFVRSKWTG
jgi:glyoxylase-like metal-dependent hydrolase (beta-lactamase superfamily II)